MTTWRRQIHFPCSIIICSFQQHIQCPALAKAKELSFFPRTVFSCACSGSEFCFVFILVFHFHSAMGSIKISKEGEEVPASESFEFLAER